MIWIIFPLAVRQSLMCFHVGRASFSNTACVDRTFFFLLNVFKTLFVSDLWFGVPFSCNVRAYAVNHGGGNSV